MEITKHRCLHTAYSTEAEASATSVASILYHDLLNSGEQATVWSLPPKAHSASQLRFG